MKLKWWERFALYLGMRINYHCNICGSTVEYDHLQRHGDWHNSLVNGDFK